jgi:MoaE-MoaD fusion protein
MHPHYFPILAASKLDSMQVRVLFFGVLKDLLSSNGEAVMLPEGATVEDLMERLRDGRTHPVWGALAVAVNREYAARSVVLREGDEVALLPPVSGGSGQESTRAHPTYVLRTHVELIRERIDREALAALLLRPADGAIVVFDGIVRDNTRGRKTLFLDYEAYEAMALEEMRRLADHASSKFEIDCVGIVHRLGRLEIGESSVVIVVTAAHRAAAFDACRWLIDTLKRTVPIWKKEHFADGAMWADGEPFPAELEPGR